MPPDVLNGLDNARDHVLNGSMPVLKRGQFGKMCSGENTNQCAPSNCVVNGSLTVGGVRLERHGSMRTPGLRRPCGSSAFFAARSASAKSGGRCLSYHGR